MYTAVFKKVWIEQGSEFVDISEQIGNIKYIRDKEKDDEVVFTIEQPYISNLSNNILRRGQTIRFQYGFKGGEKSVVHNARIVDISRKYARTVSMTVKARDLGTIMKASTSVKVWDGLTLSQICKEIADKYKLEFVGDETSVVYNNYPQSLKDDLYFLRELALREQDGNYEIYVSNGQLILERRGMDKPSEVTYTYGRDDRIISFSVKNKESNSKAKQTASTTMTGYDLTKGEQLGNEATAANEESGVNLGENAFTFSANGELIEDRSLSSGLTADDLGTLEQLADIVSAEIELVKKIFPLDSKFGRTIVTPYESPDEVKFVSNSVRKSSGLKTTTGELTLTGQPNIKLNSVITIAGVEKVDLGNYLVTSITDSVDSNGFTTKLSLEKNAGKKRNKVTDPTDIEKANTTTGARNNTSSSTLQVFDANGQLVTKTTSQYKAPK